MSPEYGATCGFFPVDDETLRYLRLTGRERRAGRARRGVLQGERPLARPRRASRRTRRSSSSTSSTVEPSLAGPRRPQDRIAARATRSVVPRRRCPSFGVDYGNGRSTRRRRELPGERPAVDADAGRRRADRDAAGAAPPPSRTCRTACLRDRRRDGRARPRRRRDRRDHLVHEHVEPGRDDRRRACSRRRPSSAASQRKPWVKTSLAPGLEGRDRVLREGRADPVPRGARLPHRRLRLHDLHRQLRARCPRRSRRRSPRATSSPAPSSRATGTSRPASIPR